MRDLGVDSGWQPVVLGELVENVNDYFERDSGERSRYIAGEHIDERRLAVRRWGFTSDPAFPPTFDRRFRGGDVLLHSRNLNKLACPDFDGVTGEKIFVLRVSKPALVLPELLPFILQTDNFNEYVQARWSGSTNKFLNKTPLMQYEFALPALDEQARLLDALEASALLVESLREAASRFDHCLFAWTEARLLRLAGDWPLEPVTRLLDRASVGIVVRPADLYVASGGVPALRSLNVHPGSLSFHDLVQISKQGHKDHPNSRLVAGDVVIVRTGRPGEAAVVPDGSGEMNCIDLIIARPGPRLRAGYLSSVLNSAFGKRQFLAGSAGTAQKHFNMGSLERLKMPAPPVEEQAAFEQSLGAMVSGARAISERIQRAVDTHIALVNTLMRG